MKFILNLPGQTFHELASYTARLQALSGDTACDITQNIETNSIGEDEILSQKATICLKLEHVLKTE